VSSFPFCRNESEHFINPYPPCQGMTGLMVCTKVPGFSQNDAHQAAPSRICLHGQYSWNHCRDGKFLCACFITVPWNQWQEPCPKHKWVEHRIPNEDDFEGANYRLGNIIDKWFSLHLSRGLPVEQKFQSELRAMLTSAPKKSFGQFLCDHTPLTSLSLQDLRNTAFEDNFMTFWAYSYEAIADIQYQYREAINVAIDAYALEVGYKMPTFNQTECVVHYRLGDMLSIGAIDPVNLANSLADWARRETTLISRFHVLISGISHASNARQIIASQNTIDVFCARLKSLFPASRILLDEHGTPDDDWFKMVKAPLLFTTHGSYATSAAAASLGLRASPAVAFADNPVCGSVYIYIADQCQQKSFPKAGGCTVARTLSMVLSLG